jgi:hypothetical protein
MRGRHDRACTFVGLVHAVCFTCDLTQFSADGVTLMVAEMWSARVTRWNATSGAFAGVVGDLYYPISISLCGTGQTSGLLAAESIADRYGAYTTHTTPVLWAGI